MGNPVTGPRLGVIRSKVKNRDWVMLEKKGKYHIFQYKIEIQKANTVAQHTNFHS